MENELVSIIVPIYNVQNYLERCIKSIANQTYSNLEIILVNDGSTDSCMDICERWKNKDIRIKVIHKVNEGLGMARNTGIENATGQYLVFVDSDDYIDENMIEQVYKVQKECNADIVCYGSYSVDKDNRIVGKVIPIPPQKIYEGPEVLEVFLPNLVSANVGKCIDWKLTMSACMAMFRYDLLRESNWRFVSEREIISEDMYSLLSLYKHVSKVAVISDAFYYYCENESSLTRTYRRDRFEKVKTCYLESIKLCERLEYVECVKERLACLFVSNVIVVLKHIVTSEEKCSVKIEDLKKILNDSIFQEVLNNIDKRNETMIRKLLFFCMRYKMIYEIYIMCLLKKRNR